MGGEFGDLMELLCFVELQIRKKKSGKHPASPKKFLLGLITLLKKEDEDLGWIPPVRGYQSVCRVCQPLLGKFPRCFCTLYYFIFNCHRSFRLLARTQSLESGSDPFCCLFLFPKASGMLRDVKPGILQPKSSEPFAGDVAVA